MSTDTDTAPATGASGPDQLATRAHLVLAETIDGFEAWALHSLHAYAQLLKDRKLTQIADPEADWQQLPDALADRPLTQTCGRRLRMGPWEWKCGIHTLHALATGDVHVDGHAPAGYSDGRVLVLEETLAEAGITIEQVRTALAGVDVVAELVASVYDPPGGLDDLRDEVWTLDHPARATGGAS